MDKILISACLLGELVRYDGRTNSPSDDSSITLLNRWLDEGRLVTVCPEMAGGLPTPRPPAEIINGDGSNVIVCTSSVKTIAGTDVTAQFITGAHKALELAEKNNCCCAILAAHSPSCGNELIYNGDFDGTLTEGQGVTAALLTKNGIKVFNQIQLDDVVAFLIK